MSTMIDTPDARAIAVGPGQGEAVWFLRSRMLIKATAEITKGAYGLIEVMVPPGFSPPQHIHHREDESFYVLDGELTVQCGDQKISASAGSYVFLPRDVPHSFVVEGDSPVRMLNITSPGGGEHFFAAGGRPAESDGLPPVGPPNIERLRAANEQYGSELVGPPLTPRSS